MSRRDSLANELIKQNKNTLIVSKQKQQLQIRLIKLKKVIKETELINYCLTTYVNTITTVIITFSHKTSQTTLLGIGWWRSSVKKKIIKGFDGKRINFSKQKFARDIQITVLITKSIAYIVFAALSVGRSAVLCCHVSVSSSSIIASKLK